MAKKAAKKAAKKKAAPAKGEFKTPAQLLREDGSNMESVHKKGNGKYSVLRYMVHKKLNYAVKKAPQYYTEEGNKRFAELFGEDGKKNMIKVEEVVEEKVEGKVEGKVEEKVVGKVEEKVVGKVEEDVEEDVPHNNELELENYELSDLEDDDDDQQDAEANAFDVETCEFVDYDTGYYKTANDSDIYNEDGERVGEIIFGEFVAV